MKSTATLRHIQVLYCIIWALKIYQNIGNEESPVLESYEKYYTANLHIGKNYLYYKVETIAWCGSQTTDALRVKSSRSFRGSKNRTSKFKYN